ncbi:hypothetical protein SEUCBS139899_000594 [Sporothrix eucalyptigena]
METMSEDEDTPNDEATNLSQHNTGDSPDTFHILSRLSTPSYTGEDDPDYGTLSSAQSDAFNHSEDAFSDDSRLSTPFYTGEDGPDYGTPNSAQTDFSNHSRDVSPDSRSPYLPTLGRTTPNNDCDVGPITPNSPQISNNDSVGHKNTDSEYSADGVDRGAYLNALSWAAYYSTIRAYNDKFGTNIGIT